MSRWHEKITMKGYYGTAFKDNILYNVDLSFYYAPKECILRIWEVFDGAGDRSLVLHVILPILGARGNAARIMKEAGFEFDATNK